MRDRRLKLGLSQEKAAEHAGISRNEWNQMERGVRGIGPTNAARIARVLGGEPRQYLTRPSRRDIEDLQRELADVKLELAELRAEVARLLNREDPPMPRQASA